VRGHSSRTANDWKPALSAGSAGTGTRTIAPIAKPTAAELGSLDLAASRLWDLDANRLTDGVHYKLDVGGAHRGFGGANDESPDPLFAYLDPAILDESTTPGEEEEEEEEEEEQQKHPTYTAFFALLDNYSREVGVAEVVTAEERREEAAFLDAIMATAPMAYAHAYLLKRGKLGRAQRSEAGFKALLHELWFELYSRSGHHGARDSSGFEHVFVGEVKEGEVSGFHNWLAFYKEERRGTVDYKGYIPARRRAKAKQRSNGRGGDERRVAPDGGSYTKREFRSYYGGYEEWDGAAVHEHDEGEKHLLTISFAWDGVIKSIGSSFIGVSPEFEMALYTLMFLCGEEENDVEIGGYKVRVTCYSMGRKPNLKIGTCFPKCLD
jgi:poly(U)-specific endoribonuclease